MIDCIFKKTEHITQSFSEVKLDRGIRIMFPSVKLYRL